MKHLCLLLVFIPRLFIAEKLPVDDRGGKNKICFTENKGQVGDQFANPRPDVLFGGMANGMAFHLRNNGVSYQLDRTDSWKEVETTPGEKTRVIDKHTVYRVDVNWLNCTPSSQIIKGAAQDGYCNYYLEVCPDGISGVKGYSEVTYKGIYKGVDLKWYQKDGSLKYDFICAAGADYRQIQIEVKGATKISISEKGELVIGTPLGDIIEEAPIVEQDGRVLPSAWGIRENIISYEINALNPERPFVIDPGIRVWGTYYGGSGQDQVKSCALDENGNVYVTGNSSSSTATVIATAGSHQTTLGGTDDAYLAKFNSNGIRLWATYYGGAGLDWSFSCATDSTQNIYIAGHTGTATANNIIATPGSHQPAHGGGTWDAFIAKFDPNGIRLWGTYYGGTGSDLVNGCVADINNNVFLTGTTNANAGTIIATPGSHQPLNGGGDDGFLVKFNSSGQRLWATYYGGPGNDGSSAVSSDKFGNVYIAGGTASTLGIATPSCHQANANGGAEVYLAKFNANGIRQWATYYGGASYEEVRSCFNDQSGNIYISGSTTSSIGNVIATPGSHQTSFAGGNADAYLVKFNSAGIRLWGTYYGGDAEDRSSNCFADNQANIWLVGLSNSTAMIASPGSHQTVFAGTPSDGMVVKFDSNGVRKWGTYYGDQALDQIMSGKADGNGNIYFGGWTNFFTGTVLATPGSHQPASGGGADAFLVKFNDCIEGDPVNVTPAGNQTFCAPGSATLNAVGNGTINWYATPTSTQVLGSGTVFITSTLGAGVYTYYAEDFACIPSNTRIAVSVTATICSELPEQELVDQLKIYPNPNNGIFVVEQNYPEVLTIGLYDATGRLVASLASADKITQVNILTLPPGMYCLVVNGVKKKLSKL